MDNPQSEVLEQVKTLGTDLRKQIADIEGKYVEKADMTDAKAQFKNLEEKYNEALNLAKKAGGDIEALATRVNRDLVPNEGRAEVQKAYETQILDGLKSMAEKSTFGREIKGSYSFELKGGQGALHTKAVGDMSNANLSGYASRDIRTNVVAGPYRKTRVRNLLNVGTMSGALLEYPKKTGGEGAVANQTEGSSKAQVDYDFTMTSVIPQTIAAFARVSKQSLADISWLANFMATQMTQDWLDHEDNQILNGSGTGTNLNGIITQATDYTKTAALGLGTTYYEVLADAIAQLEGTNYTATGILLNPLDFVKLIVYKGTSGEFSHPGLVYNDNILSFYGVPVIKNNAIAQGTGLVGDWTRAELLVREGLSFDMSYDDSDNFTKNKVTLRIEGREGLAVYHTAGFRNITFIEVAS